MKNAQGEEPRQTIAEEWHQEKPFQGLDPKIKLTQLEEKGEALQRIKPRFECARASCPMNRDGQSCAGPQNWFTCRRHQEP